MKPPSHRCYIDRVRAITTDKAPPPFARLHYLATSAENVGEVDNGTTIIRIVIILRKR